MQGPEVEPDFEGIVSQVTGREAFRRGLKHGVIQSEPNFLYESKIPDPFLRGVQIIASRRCLVFSLHLQRLIQDMLRQLVSHMMSKRITKVTTTSTLITK
jgi:hypothetical protein